MKARRWFRGDGSLHRNPKLAALECGPQLLYFKMLSWAADNETDGRIPRSSVVQGVAGFSATQVAAFFPILEQSGFFEPLEDGSGWYIHDYLEFNPTIAHQRQISRVRRKAGKRGGQRKHERRLANAKAIALANALAKPWQTPVLSLSSRSPLDQVSSPSDVSSIRDCVPRTGSSRDAGPTCQDPSRPDPETAPENAPSNGASFVRVPRVGTNGHANAAPTLFAAEIPVPRFAHTNGTAKPKRSQSPEGPLPFTAVEAMNLVAGASRGRMYPIESSGLTAGQAITIQKVIRDFPRRETWSDVGAWLAAGAQSFRESIDAGAVSAHVREWAPQASGWAKAGRKPLLREDGRPALPKPPQRQPYAFKARQNLPPMDYQT